MTFRAVWKNKVFLVTQIFASAGIGLFQFYHLIKFSANKARFTIHATFCLSVWNKLDGMMEFKYVEIPSCHLNDVMSNPIV